MQPKIIIHGGAGSTVESKGGYEPVRKSLFAVLETVYPMLLNGTKANCTRKSYAMMLPIF